MGDLDFQMNYFSYIKCQLPSEIKFYYLHLQNLMLPSNLASAKKIQRAQ